MHKKKYESAYMTVEAALLFPMILLFIVMMMFLAIYSYDRCVLETSAYKAALCGTCSCFNDAKEISEEVSKSAAALTNNRLFGTRDFKFDVSVNADEVTVMYHCKINMPFITWLEKYISDIDMTLDVERSARRYRPTRTIRTFRAIVKQ